jgi:hypothetical protein
MHLAKQGSQAYEQEFWSCDVLWDYCRKKPEQAWRAIVEIYECRAGEVVLSNLAAGPVEDLLVYHGELVLPWIEQYCAEHAEFVDVLQMVWRNAMSDEVWDGLNRLIRK